MSENGFMETVSSEYDDDSEQKMVLYIETLTGTAFEMIVSPMDSILSIKNKIHHDEGIPINQQHLLLGEKELRNTSYLKEEGVTRGCTLRLVLGMRGGPISTRRASSRSEHLIWREIKDFVETTRDDMMAKVPAGCKITFLIYREGDTINLLKVVENNDGSYSSLSDLRKSRSESSSTTTTSSTSSGRSRMNVRTDTELHHHPPHTNVNNIHNVTLNKMAELRRKMEELNIKKYKKLHKITTDNDNNNVATNNNNNTASTCAPLCPPLRANEIELQKKKNKLDITVFDDDDDDEEEESSATIITSNTKPKTDKTKRYHHQSTDKAKSSKSKVKQWLNSDYYDDASLVPLIPRKSKHSITTYHDGGDISTSTGGGRRSHHHHQHHHQGNYYINKTYKLQAMYTDSSDDNNETDNYVKNKYKSSTESIKRILIPTRKDLFESSTTTRSAQNDDCIRNIHSGDDDDDVELLLEDENELNDTFIDHHNTNMAAIHDDSATRELLAEYYPKISRTELRQSIESHIKPLIDDSNLSAEEDIDRNCGTSVHETSSIAILEEDSETNVVNDESEFNPPSGPISVPSPDANTFTISQIPRERVSTSSGTTSTRNHRIRVARFVLKNDQQRPKTTPDKISREFCEFLLNDISTDQHTTTTKCYEEEPHQMKNGGNKLRFKRTKYISASSSKLDKINNIKSTLSTATNTVCSWPRVSSSNKSTACRIGGGITCCSGGHHMSNRFKLTKFENILSNEKTSTYDEGILKTSTTTLSGIQNKGFLENIESSSSSKQQNEKAEELNQENRKKENRNENNEIVVEHLPPIKQKKTQRVRCKMCMKKLNIATIHTCRCGDHFCSQHRYSEVHGCKYDYKTEGRKVIEQANPLIRAPKLPKI